MSIKLDAEQKNKADNAALIAKYDPHKIDILNNAVIFEENWWPPRHDGELYHQVRYGNMTAFLTFQKDCAKKAKELNIPLENYLNASLKCPHLLPYVNDRTDYFVLDFIEILKGN